MNLVPVIFLTGFLGSGKTTILRSLLSQREMAGTAVMINEFGEIGIDHLLIDSPVFKPVLLANGCVCCASRGQLTTSLEELAGSTLFAKVQRVIVETTGLANPVPLLQSLVAEHRLAERFRFGGLVTTADCVNGAATLKAYEEAVCQIAVADIVLITKTDIASAEAHPDLKRALRAINPGTRMLNVVSGAIDAEVFSDLTLHDALTQGGSVSRWLGAHVHERDGQHIHANGVGTFSIIRDDPLPWMKFVRWLETIAAACSDDLLRVKGLVNVAEWPDGPVVVHGVQHVFHPPVRLAAWPDEDRRTRLVFITRGLAKQAIEASLRLLDCECEVDARI